MDCIVSAQFGLGKGTSGREVDVETLASQLIGEEKKHETISKTKKSIRSKHLIRIVFPQSSSHIKAIVDNKTNTDEKMNTTTILIMMKK